MSVGAEPGAAERLSEIAGDGSEPLMPEGILSRMEADEIRDLIGYLMHPTQVNP